MKTCRWCSKQKPSEEFRGLRCRDCRLQWHREHYREGVANGTRSLRQDKMRRYGISVERYEEILAEQGGGCAICHAPPPKGSSLDVDHDHACCPKGTRACGRCVRGLLCRRCNLLLGKVQDDPSLLEQAVQYLLVTMKHPEKAA